MVSNLPVVLDTHAWIWLVGGDRTLGADALEAIEAAGLRGAVLVPAISVWEVGTLEAKGRITLGKPCRQWVAQALSAPGICLAPLAPEIALESSRLPGAFHGDPADRMVVATARMEDALLVTRDRRIVDYARQGHVRVIEA